MGKDTGELDEGRRVKWTYSQFVLFHGRNFSKGALYFVERKVKKKEKVDLRTPI